MASAVFAARSLFTVAVNVSFVSLALTGCTAKLYGSAVFCSLPSVDFEMVTSPAPGKSSVAFTESPWTGMPR